MGPERIEARTVLWAAGVAASPLARSLGAPLDRAGRVLVEPDLTIPGHPEVISSATWRVEQDGKPVPGVAPAAIQEGQHAAKNIVRSLRGQPRLPFRYRDKGSLATIGRAAAVADDRHQALRLDRLAGLAVRPHLLPDRVPQPLRRDIRMGLVVPHLRPGRPADHGTAKALEEAPSLPCTVITAVDNRFYRSTVKHQSTGSEIE